MGISPYATLAICVVGNMVPLVPLFLALRSQAAAAQTRRTAPCPHPLEPRSDHFIGRQVVTQASPRSRREKLAGLPTGQSRWLALTLFVGVPAPDARPSRSP